MGAPASEVVAALSCRSACALKLGLLAQAQEDITEALSSDGLDERLHLKLLLRRASARMQAGSLQQVVADVEAASTFARNAEEERAVAHLRSQLDESSQGVV